MIDYEISPRGSGKTRELVEMYKRNPGLYICHSVQEAKRIKKVYDVDAKSWQELEVKDIDLADWIYLDEYFMIQNFDDYDLMILDEDENKNLVVRGTPYDTDEPSDDLIEYLKEKYPEYCI